MVFIGWFLTGAAGMSYRQHLFRVALEGVRVRELMSDDPQTVSPDLTVQALVDEHLLLRRYQSFPVVDGGRTVGLVTLDQVKALDRKEWPRRRVFQIMLEIDTVPVVSPDQPMLEAMDQMRDADSRRLLVISNGTLAGILSSSDVARWVQRTQELGV